MKKVFLLLLAVIFAFSLSACSKTEASEVEKIIAEAENMTLEELFAKAYEESNGLVLEGIGNSSRGATAGLAFVAAIQEIYPDYTGSVGWQQPKENSIFQMLESDSTSLNPIFSMTLIQDGSQVQSKMIDTGILHNFIPLEWREANGVDVENNGYPLTLQTLNKVLMYNNVGGKTMDNVWDFVKEGEAPMFMGIDSEPVGFNFLLMLTDEKYANIVKDAYDALDDTEKAYFSPIVDALASKADELGLSENGKYSLAWIKLWTEQINVMTDDGPIMAELVTTSAVDETALIVYSKFRSIEETTTSSVNNVTVAAYEPGFVGFGGFGYKHFLQIPESSPLPWTAAAFIAYMVIVEDGFHPWGKDMGGYSANPALRLDHTQDGYVDGVNTYPVKNDRGYEWWISTGVYGGRLVIEDPLYTSSTAFTVGEWISSLD